MSQDSNPGFGVRARAKAANRRAILDAAREVFAIKGYEAASVRDVIRRTGLASGTFYNYFKSKEELFAALAADAIDQFRPLLVRAHKDSETFEEFVHTVYRAYFEYFLEDSRRLSMIEGETPARFAAPSDLDVIFNEVHELMSEVFNKMDVEVVDTEYVAAAAVGIAREMRSRLIRREAPNAVEAGRIAATFFLSGLEGLRRDSSSR